MLFCFPGVAPIEVTELLQSLGSFILRFGFILSREISFVEIKLSLCHLSEYHTESITFPFTSLRIINSPVFTSPRLDPPTIVVRFDSSKPYLLITRESAANKKNEFSGIIIEICESLLL